jgi:predicted Zn-dependent protease
VLLAQEGRREALQYCRQAVESAPDNEKFVFTRAYYLDQFQQTSEAIEVLEAFQARQPAGMDTRMLLADLYLKSGQSAKARGICESALRAGGLLENQRAFFEARLRALTAAPGK